MRTLLPSQIKAKQYYRTRNRIALFMEMRLGKTGATIDWTRDRKASKVLVLCPNPVKDAWKRECEDEGEKYFEMSGSSLQKLEQSKDFFKLHRTRFLLCNNEVIHRQPAILRNPYSAIVIDESTSLKNPQSKFTKTLVKYSSHISKRAILTGLPNPESEMDFFMQFVFLYGKFMGESNFWKWRQRYFRNPHKFATYEWVPRPGTLEHINREIHSLSFTLSRKQAGMPDTKIYEIRKVEFTDPQKKIYNQALKKLFIQNEEGEVNKATKYVPVSIGWASRIASGFDPELNLVSDKKLNEIYYLLKNELKDEKIVIWFKHNLELNFVADSLKESEYEVAKYYSGNKENLDTFIKGSTQILCAQLRCGKMGLNWSMASVAIYYSNWFDNEIRAQSEDRIVSPLKSEPLLYVDLVTRNSIDEDTVELLRDKKLNSKEMLEEVLKRTEERLGVKQTGSRTGKRIHRVKVGKRLRLGHFESEDNET